MSLRKQYHKEKGFDRPSEPFSESENPEEWAILYGYEEGYSEWLESELAKVQSTNSAVKSAKGVDVREIIERKLVPFGYKTIHIGEPLEVSNMPFLSKTRIELLISELEQSTNIEQPLEVVRQYNDGNFTLTANKIEQPLDVSDKENEDSVIDKARQAVEKNVHYPKELREEGKSIFKSLNQQKEQSDD